MGVVIDREMSVATRDRRHLHLVLATVALLFSLNYILAKIVLRDIRPLTFAYIRIVGSAIVLQCIRLGVRSPRDLPFTGKEWRDLIGFSLLGVVFNQILFLSGLSLTTAHKAAILITTIPIFALLAALVIGQESASVARVAGILVAAAGAIFIIGTEHLEGQRSIVIGDLLILLNCLSYALYLVLSRSYMKRFPPIRIVSAIFSFGVVLTLPFCTHDLSLQSWSAIRPSAWLALLAVILGPTVGAYLLSGWALARADSSLVAAYSYLQPLLASILATAILGEVIKAEVFTAAILIFGGVYLAARPAR